MSEQKVEAQKEEYLNALLDRLRGILDELDKGLKEGLFPEASRSYLERLGRNIRDTLRVIEILAQENTIQSPLSPSGRGAMYNLRRAFYAVLGRLAREQQVDRERSVACWREAAQKIVEFMNREGISEAPSKIVLSYKIVEEDGKRYIKPTRAEILYFELEGIKILDLEQG